MSTEDVRRFVTERQTRTPESMRRMLGSKPRKGAFEELMEGIGHIREPMYRKTLEASVAQDRDAPIENIRVPTRIIAGEDDRVYPSQLATTMAARIPGAELITMKRTGHLANLERPERFNEILLEFLLRHNG
jgi:pimeloyl-ACP methyl ester carboxylesterase